MHGLNQGTPVMKFGGSDAALARQGAAEERVNMMQQLQRLFGMSQLPGPRAYIAPPLQ